MVRALTRVLVVVLLSLVPCAAAQSAPGRTEVSLNGQWETVVVELLEKPPANVEWKTTSVPGSFRSVRGQRRWLRRRFDVPKEWEGRRVYIVYDGVKYDSRHSVNGKEVGRHFRGYDRFEIDATPAIRFGQANELLVGCADWQNTFEKPVDLTDKAGGHTARYYPKNVGLTPIGGRFYDYGIWADVKLVAVSPVHVSDVTIRTSVRKQLLDVEIEVRNAGKAQANVEVKGQVAEAKGIALEPKQVQLKPGEKKALRWQVPWKDPKLWSFNTPHLYHLDATVATDGKQVDARRTRFGFREFWCEGSYFRLNGARLLLRSSSMWPLGAADKDAAAERLQRMKDNINIICFRTHTQPWRQHWYEAADEMGMLMIPEGPVFNDDNLYKLDDQRFWDNYAAELRSMVQRFKNNPSVVMHSLENEFWGGKMNDKSPHKPQLVRLGELMRQWDPTRPFMYESDGDPGEVADVIGLHYPWEMGKNYLYPNGCYWMDTPIKPTHWFTNGAEEWKWNRKKPLYIGEYLWSPCPTPKRYTTFFGDEAYHDYRKYHNAAIGLAWSFQTRVYRYYRVSGLCPWTCAGGSLDVTKDPMAAGQAESMRPLAAFVKEYTSRFYSGSTVRRTLHVMNDTLYGGTVKVSWGLAVEGGGTQRGEMEFDMDPADLRVEQLEIKMPDVKKTTGATLTVRATMPNAPDFEDVMPCRVYPRQQIHKPEKRLAVFGKDAVQKLRSAGLDVSEIEDLSKIPANADLLILGPNSLPAEKKDGAMGLHIRRGGGVQQTLQRYVEGGGRVLMLAQAESHVPIGSVRFAPRQATMTFPLVRRHPILSGLTDEDLKFWMPDHFVADAQVDRVGCGGQAILVTGGDVGIAFSPLTECRFGKGLVIACGLRVVDALEDEPIATMMLSNILKYMDEWTCDPSDCVVVPAGGALAKELARLRLGVRAVKSDAAISPEKTCLVACSGDPGAAVLDRFVETYVKPGGLLWWHRPDGKALAHVMKRVGIECTLNPSTGPVKLDWDSPFVDGLAQADLWWPGDKRKGAPGWAARPLAPAIIDYEAGVIRRIDPAKAKSVSCLDMKVTGSRHNRALKEFAILASSGSVIGTVDFGKGGPMLLGIRAKGSPCENIWPRVEVRVDGEAVGYVSVTSDQPATYAVIGKLEPGKHEVELRFVNDASNLEKKEDRNVFISHILLQPIEAPKDSVRSHATPSALVSVPVGKGSILIDTIKWDEPGVHAAKARAFATSLLLKLGAHPRAFALTSMEAEDMDVEEIAHNKKRKTEVVLANVGSIRTKILADVPGEYDLCIHGRGSVAKEEWPILTVKLDDKEIGQVTLDSLSTAPVSLPVKLTEGEHTLEMRFINDFCDPGKADRNAYIDKVEIWSR